MHIPKLCRHKSKNLAFVIDGKKRIYLGKWGDPVTEANYRAYINEITRPGGRVIREDPNTVSDLALAFMKARQRYYVKNGRQTGQLARFKAALEYPLKLYPTTPLEEFGPRKLLAVRNAMEESGRFARSYINTLVNCIRGVFRWGVENEIVAPETLTALTSVSPLKRRRSIARETEPVAPVDPDVFEKTIALLPPTLADMARVQRHTGMRPGEVCAMRSGDLALNERNLLVYTLRTDKTDYRRDASQKRKIYIGPKVEAILAPYLLHADDPDAYVFTPENAIAERNRARITKNPRRKRKPKKRRLTPCYNTASYAKAISRAAQAAGVTHWTPNQLRHLFASEIRQKYGLEAAQIMLGHAKADVTQIYAERDARKMEEIASQEG